MIFIIVMLWAFVVFRVLMILFLPVMIGRPRDPLTPGSVILQSLVNVFGIVILALAAVALTSTL